MGLGKAVHENVGRNFCTVLLLLLLTWCSTQPIHGYLGWIYRSVTGSVILT